MDNLSYVLSSLFSGTLFQGAGQNECLRGKGFYVSYNPDTNCGKETALVKGGKFYILLGDYRKQYKPCIKKGFKVCKARYDLLVKGGAEVSPWSSDADL